MLIMSIDTASSSTAVSIIDEYKVMFELIVDYKKNHSETIMTAVDTALKFLDIDVSRLHCIVASVGPGSFTGLRVGVATAKAIAYAHDLSSVAISSLAALAYNVCVHNTLIVPILRANRSLVYAGFYYWERDNLVRFKDDMVTDVLTALKLSHKYQYTKNKFDKVILVGHEMFVNKDKVSDYGFSFYISPLGFNAQRGSSLASLALQYIKQGSNTSLDDVELSYLMKPQAEISKGAV